MLVLSRSQCLLFLLTLVVFLGCAHVSPKQTAGQEQQDAQAPAAEGKTPSRLNVLLITADDMNYDAPGTTGCRIPNITPNIDRLGSEGVRFEHAHVTIAVCQPSRSVLMTGRYPHRNGALGFQAINPKVPTLQESLRAAGYLNGIMGKVGHLAPQKKFCWDSVVTWDKLGMGRNPTRYYEHAKAFFKNAKKAGKPFFLMANSHDPHRPFASSYDEEHAMKRWHKRWPDATFPQPNPCYKPDDVPVPGFLPVLPDVSREVAQYYNSVHRCDETVGAVLRALEETGFADNTLVMFLSDNGMAFPFAKTNCYLASTRTPWIVRWPGKAKPGTLDTTHFISGIDFMATILDAVGIEQIDGMDGKSFLPAVIGQPQPGRDDVFTVFNKTAGRRKYPMRCVQNRQFGYIFNAWADGKTVFLNESQSGLTFKAMKAAAQNDEQIAARVKLFQYRVPEEFYDFESDPDARKNLIDDPAYRDEIKRLRNRMLEIMTASDDPLLDVFKKHIRSMP